MAFDYDQQILESVSVRRDRLLKSLLFGAERTRRTYSDGARLLLIGIVIAAVVCAGCIGYSFVVDLFAAQQDRTGLALPAPGVVPGARA
ncbi:hypothetical protein [Zhihengliuella salsuginis]|uniref:hypothetical protein n=1 Tax=Zhihengliuella salsuginis TaxID=578222 RepID=UPI001673B18F|nr:hypothetical protein [Zhihengliuella salsuginis]